MNNKKTIFLSGPMRGVPRKEALAWRKKAGQILSAKFNLLHAYRGREKKETFADPRLAITRDKNDILKSDLVLVNCTRHDASMIGTSMEILFAFENNKTIIIFGDAHIDNYWLNYHIHARESSLESACKLINKMFY